MNSLMICYIILQANNKQDKKPVHSSASIDILDFRGEVRKSFLSTTANGYRRIHFGDKVYRKEAERVNPYHSKKQKCCALLSSMCFLVRRLLSALENSLPSLLGFAR